MPLSQAAKKCLTLQEVSMKCISIALVAALCMGAGVSSVSAEGELTAEQQAKVTAKLKIVEGWGTDAAVVKAVVAYNTNPPAEAKAMTQEKWAALTVISPEVKALTKNELGVWLKAKKDESIAEAFISGADGNKVALTSKTSSWCHKGKPKHDVPMTGKSWQGKPEMDESTGLMTVQVAVPVLDGGKAVGSIVVGLTVSKL
jgi:hypothetical protein